jgi:hypothetical protein
MAINRKGRNMRVHLFWYKDGSLVTPGTLMASESAAKQEVLERYPDATFTAHAPCQHQPGPMRSCDEMMYAKSVGVDVAEIWLTG